MSSSWNRLEVDAMMNRTLYQRVSLRLGMAVVFVCLVALTIFGGLNLVADLEGGRAYCTVESKRPAPPLSPTPIPAPNARAREGGGAAVGLLSRPSW